MVSIQYMKRERGVQRFGQDTHHKYWCLNPALLSLNPGIVIPRSPEILESLILNVTRLRVLFLTSEPRSLAQ